jgi:hypothetical protein
MIARRLQGLDARVERVARTATLGLREARTAERNGFTPSRKGNNDPLIHGGPENKCAPRTIPLVSRFAGL